MIFISDALALSVLQLFERQPSMNKVKVVSNARKLIFRPAQGVPIVSFPEGAVISSYGAGNDAPTVVVQNCTCKDKSWQGVSHETGSVIVNNVPAVVAIPILQKYAQDGQTIEALRAALSELANYGYDDQYTAPFNFMDNKLSPAGLMIDQYTGIVKRDDKDLVDCWREGDTYYVTPNGKPRVIDACILVRDYRMSDGKHIYLENIQEIAPA